MQDTRMDSPSDVRAGPTHPDPYFYYRGLAADRPLFYDDEHGTEIGVEHLLASGIALEALEAKLTYAAPAHIRTPLFHG